VAKQERSGSAASPRLLAHQFALLIDENLTPELVRYARSRGFRASHVNDVNLRTRKDKDVARYAVEHGMVVVTNDMADFSKVYARRKLHPGLIFLCAAQPVLLTRNNQATLLGVALDDILRHDLLQEVLRVLLLRETRDTIDWELTRHELPRHGT
jgi:predicted nuclease of predicted toxin-antitoxin system